MTEPIRVLLVDDQDLIRVGFRLVLEAEADMSVVGEAGDGEEAIRRARELRPDVVLMDIRMPGLDGIAATEAIVAAMPDTRVLVLTTFDLDEYAFGAIRAGASGFLLKDAQRHEMTSAVRAVHRGDAALSPRVTRRLLEHLGRSERIPPEGCPAARDDVGSAGRAPRGCCPVAARNAATSRTSRAAPACDGRRLRPHRRPDRARARRVPRDRPRPDQCGDR